MNSERDHESNPVFLDKSGNAVVQKEIAAQREVYKQMRAGRPTIKPPERRMNDRRQSAQIDRRQGERRNPTEPRATS